MKKLLLILLCLPMIGFCQQEISESDQKKKNQNSFEIGVVFGSTSSNIYGKLKDLYDMSSSTNVNSMQRKNGGFMLQYNISDLLSVNSKLLYQVKGWYLKDNNLEMTTVELPEGGIGTYDVDASIYNHYISLPILMQINFGNKLRGTINTGFYASYLLDVIEITEYSNIDTTIRVVLGDNIIVEEQDQNKGNPQRYTDPIEGYSRFDLGFIVGGGVSYIINDRIRLSFESNLEYGLINKYIQDNPFTNYNIAYNFLFGCSYIL
jgi:hypothetical protein